MKVGADSMVFGALVPVTNAAYILDIGAGTGVLSLMLAQRCLAKIHAIEIDENAYIQAARNALNSRWCSRINVFHTSLQNYHPQNKQKYDLIISNPPYFLATASVKSKSPEENRAAARDQNQLSFTDLITNAARLLSHTGNFYVIIPFAAKQEFIGLAEKNSLHLIREINIRSRPETPFIRAILGFSFANNIPILTRDFTIYEKGNIYTEEYLLATENYHAHNMRKRKM
ncbi:MAG: tRNA1(Val) (adenine(37)-N6)-methyltransferase [Bacteroidia bacterium]